MTVKDSMSVEEGEREIRAWFHMESPNWGDINIRAILEAVAKHYHGNAAPDICVKCKNGSKYS